VNYRLFSEGGVEWEMTEFEKDSLVDLVKSFPVIEPGYHRISRLEEVDEEDERQQLLEESIAEQYIEDRKRLENLVYHERFEVEAEIARIQFNADDLDFLLLVLNNIRVGHWIRAGCPDEKKMKTLRLDPEHGIDFFRMFLCERFEAMILVSMELLEE